MKKKKRILIVDDDKDVVAVLTMILEGVGYEVKSTAGRRTAQKVDEYLPDLIILDIWMIGIDGRDICTYLKNQKRTKHIPIIMISANNDIEKIAKDAEADDFIAKPFQMNDLLTMVKKIWGPEKSLVCLRRILDRRTKWCY